MRWRTSSGNEGSSLRSPPWDSDHPPSSAESENKVRRIIKEIDDDQPEEALSGLSLDALLEKAEETLAVRYDQDQERLANDLSDIDNRRNRLVAFRELQERVKSERANIRDKKLQLSEVLGGLSIDEIRSKIQKMHALTNTLELRRKLVEDATLVLNREEAKSVSCPVCEVVHSREDLEAALGRLAGQLTEEMNSDLVCWENKLQMVEELDQEVQRLEATLLESEEELSARQLEIGELHSPQASAEDLDAMICFCSERAKSIEAQIDSREDWRNGKGAQLSKLREEGKFHRILKNLRKLSQSRNRFAQVEKAFQELVTFGESVRTVRQAVEFCLNERLRREIPTVSANLSKVFAALTQHSWFDRLVIAKETLPKLELRVMSSNDSAHIVHPTGVLNGQAESALALVPYFAFSQADDAPTEVYLVLLDDPTRAFDEETHQDFGRAPS